MKIDTIRKEYLSGSLSEEQLTENPMDLFKSWFTENLNTGNEDANAMILSTIGLDGYPETRIVLLKSIEKNAFSFFTNYESPKSKAIENSPMVSLTFFWPEFQRQVRIKGIATKVAEEISNAYFNSRPKESRLGAWASDQSKEISSREILDKKFQELTEMFKNKTIPRPKHWGGFQVEPVSIEFWQGRANRLHDRFLYTKNNYVWNIKRLAP